MRASEQIQRSSNKLAFVIVQQLQDVAQGRGPGREAQLADALNAYGRAIAFMAEEEVTSELAGKPVHVGPEMPNL